MVRPLEADVISLGVKHLGPAMGLQVAQVVTETPGNLTPPLLQIVRAGGGDDGLVVDEPLVVTHCFAATPYEARALAYQAGTGWRALIGQVLDGMTIQSVRTVSGPQLTAYANTSLREAVRTDLIRIKPA